MGLRNTYSDEHILKQLKKHLITNMGSVYSMHSPTWEGIKKRMNKSEELEEEVKNLQAQALWQWEKKGLDNLEGRNPDFNTGLYKHFTQSKRSFLPTVETTSVDENVEIVQK